MSFATGRQLFIACACAEHLPAFSLVVRFCRGPARHFVERGHSATEFPPESAPGSASNHDCRQHSAYRASAGRYSGGGPGRLQRCGFSSGFTPRSDKNDRGSDPWVGALVVTRISRLADKNGVGHERQRHFGLRQHRRLGLASSCHDILAASLECDP